MPWLAILLACFADPAESDPNDYPPATAPSHKQADPQERDWMSLPRFERLWQRDGIGLHTGIVDKNTYYTVTDDKARLVALDPRTGHDRWQSKLPNPMAGYAHLVLVGDRIIVSSEVHGDEQVQLLQATTDGRIGWSRTVRCKRHTIETAPSRLFLRCHESAPLRGPSTLVEIDLADGSELFRMSIDSKLKLMPNGFLCRSDEKQVACFQPVRDKLEPRWSTPVIGTSRYAQLEGTAAFIVCSDENSVDVFQSKDGRKVFHRAAGNGGRWIERKVQGDRLFLFGRTGIEMIRLSDGHSMAKILWNQDRSTRLLSLDKQMLVVSGTGVAPQAGLIDPQGRLTRIDFPPADVRTVVEDVVLAHRLGPPRYFGRDGALSAYSTSRLVPRASTLPVYERILAILEHFPDPYWAFDVLASLRSIPAGLDNLEELIRRERGYARITAIAVAGASGLLRYLPVLRDMLNQMAPLPGTSEERERLLQTVHALVSLDTPQVAEVLLAYWRTAEPYIVQTDLHYALKETIQYVIWRYSGERDWGVCPDRSFPVGKQDLTKAELGTPSPGAVEVIDRNAQWALLCEARNDDDKNGRLSVEYQMHGGTTGDQLRPYLILGSGAGTEVDDFLAADANGRHVVVAMQTCLYLVDAQTGAARALRRADGRVRIGPKQDAPIVAFSRDGIWLAYLRANGRQVHAVLRDLMTGAEREIDPKSASVLSLFFDNLSSSLVMDVADFEGDLRAKPWATTESAHHHCREGSERRSAIAEPEPRPVLRRCYVSVHGGPVRDADHPSELEPDPSLPPKYNLLPSTPTDDFRELPIGPFHWQK